MHVIVIVVVVVFVVLFIVVSPGLRLSLLQIYTLTSQLDYLRWLT